MIPGITNRVRYQRLGKIRLGEKAQGARGEYPKATDHFVFDEGAAAVAKAYPGNCTLIAPVLLPGNPKRAENGAWDFETYWKTSRSAYGKSSGLFCRSTDGEIATRFNKGLDEKTQKPIDPQGWHALKIYEKEKGITVEPGEMFDMVCPGEECPLFEKKVCKNLGSLDLMLPKVAGFGVWTVQTSSFNSIRNIQSTLEQLADALGGQLAGIPLALRLVPQQAQVEGRAKTIFVMELLCPHNLQQLAGLRRKALSAGGGVMAAIEGEIPPDDLYPNAGADLDRDLGGVSTAVPPGEPRYPRPAAPTAAPAEPAPDPAAAIEEHQQEEAHRLGKALGMSTAQVELALRRAGTKNWDGVIQEWTRQIAARGGEAQEDVDAEVLANDPADMFPEAQEDEERAAAAPRGPLGPPPPLTRAQEEQLEKDLKASAGRPAQRREQEVAREAKKQAPAQKPIVQPNQEGRSPYDV